MPTIAKNSSKFPPGSRLHQQMKSIFLSFPLSNSSLWYHQQLYERVFAVCKIIMSLRFKTISELLTNVWQESQKPLFFVSWLIWCVSVDLLHSQSMKVICSHASFEDIVPVQTWIYFFLWVVRICLPALLSWTVEPEKHLNDTEAFLVIFISLFRSRSINPSGSFWHRPSALCRGPDWLIYRCHQLVIQG